MFSSEHYKHDIVDFEASWKMAKELNDEWKMVVKSFIEFLDSCGGIVRVV